MSDLMVLAVVATNILAGLMVLGIIFACVIGVCFPPRKPAQ